MSNFEVRQFKLTNQEEIVCEDLEWPSAEEPSMVIRKAMKIIVVENYGMGSRYYAFRPWMLMQDDLKNHMQILNTMHIVSETNPSIKLKDQYYKFLLELEKQISMTKGTNINHNVDKKVLKELQKDLKELETLINNGDIDLNDSNQNNIIEFRPKGTLH